MRLTEGEARSRLAGADHGVLATTHPDRGVDAVPAVFALDTDGWLGVPIDTVKPKASTTLQRQRNLAADPRATLLVEHWDRDEWSALWWVRAALRHEPAPPPPKVAALAAALSVRYPQYAEHPFAAVLVFRVVGLTGWSAA